MPTIEDTACIDAPIDDVFEYLASPENHVDVVPSLVEGPEDADQPNGRTAGEFTFEMLGVGLDGHFRDVEFEPPTVGCIVSKGHRVHVGKRDDDRGGDLTLVGENTTPMYNSCRSRRVGSGVP